MRLRAGGAVVVLTGLLGAAACNGGDTSDGATATVPAAAATTTTTNPYAVPEVIDEPYVERVLAALDGVVGDVVRVVMRTRDVPPEVIDRVKAVYLDRDGQNVQLTSVQQDLREGFRGFRSDPGNKRSTVTDMLVATPTCVFVKVERDYSAVSTSADPKPTTEWIVLKPVASAADPNSYNPTPWAFARVAVEAPAQPC